MAWPCLANTLTVHFLIYNTGQILLQVMVCLFGLTRLSILHVFYESGCP